MGSVAFVRRRRGGGAAGAGGGVMGSTGWLIGGC